MTETVVVITTDNKVETRELEIKDGLMLEGLQEIVGGYIETVPLTAQMLAGCTMVVNEEGALMDLPVNIIASIIYASINCVSYILGDVAICRIGERDGEPDIVGLDKDRANRIVRVLSQLVVHKSEQQN